MEMTRPGTTPRTRPIGPEPLFSRHSTEKSSWPSHASTSKILTCTASSVRYTTRFVDFRLDVTRLKEVEYHFNPYLEVLQVHNRKAVPGTTIICKLLAISAPGVRGLHLNLFHLFTMADDLVDLSLFEEFPSHEPAWRIPSIPPSQYFYHEPIWGTPPLPPRTSRRQRAPKSLSALASVLTGPGRDETSPSRWLFSRVIRFRLGHAGSHSLQDLPGLRSRRNDSSSRSAASLAPGSNPAPLAASRSRTRVPATTASSAATAHQESQPKFPMIWLADEQMWLVADPSSPQLQNSFTNDMPPPPSYSQSEAHRSLLPPLHPATSSSTSSLDPDSLVREQFLTLFEQSNRVSTTSPSVAVEPLIPTTMIATAAASVPAALALRSTTSAATSTPPAYPPLSPNDHRSRSWERDPPALEQSSDRERETERERERARNQDREDNSSGRLRGEWEVEEQFSSSSLLLPLSSSDEADGWAGEETWKSSVSTLID